ncbi:MAG TPA: peptidoglycan DD-metalloendopeptidase family protein [Alphaproteobacteria bacterium]
MLGSIVKTILVRLIIEGRHALVFIPGTVFHAVRCRALPLKERHVYTRTGRLRLRYVAVLAALFLGIAGSNMSFTPNFSVDVASAQAGIADMAIVDQKAAVAPTAEMVFAPSAPVKPTPARPAAYTRAVKIHPGDTLSDLVAAAGPGIKDKAEALEALKKHIDPRSLKAGDEVTMHYIWQPGQGENLAGMEFAPTELTRIMLVPTANGGFKVDKSEKTLQHEVRAAHAKIRTSLSADLQAAGVPASIINEFTKAYSYSVDFARDIWAGDTVDILYDVNRTDDGNFVRGETLKYAALTMRGKTSVIIRFDDKGNVQYYDEKGNPVKKALLRTPVDAARMTSGFGARRHPVLGYNRMHKGVDFGAPTGTPIYAAGDGIVSRAGKFSGYGNYVSIKHNGTYSTAYGHMSKILVKNGQHVKQGQVIGKVGATGLATGPHLHFEVLKSGTQINPVKAANLSIGDKLGGKTLARFQAVAADAKGSFNSLMNAAHLQQASLNTTPISKPIVEATAQ